MGTCPDSIKRLIDHFDRQSAQIRSPDYNETQLRIDFVNPMFEALGWDIDNRQRFAEQYREVVHEDRVKVAGATKAPDYSFRVGGVRKFFLEAKRPAVDIHEALEPAYQLRRYGWSAKLAVSLLTDFEELAIYDCRIRPKFLDKARTGRRDYIGFRDYPEQWDFLEGTFSKQAVLRGDFDRYCQSAKGRGAEAFDEAFLEEIEQWRHDLALNLALRNEALDERSLNFAVQRIIDRIIFLRICEDRGTEHTGQLQGLLNGEGAYGRLAALFRAADERYNSGLFHFKREKERDEAPDELTPSLAVDDAVLKKIIGNLYYPQSPYEFTVVSADILGSVYERFLGKVITLTAGPRARVDEKPEVRKAGGVYYTPTYIVDYIVKQTVGKLLEGEDSGFGVQGSGGGRKTPKEAAKLKILDPACGSGSFLLGAYQYLLDWHLDWYIAHDAPRWSKGKEATLRPGPDGGWRLSIQERKRILLDNIHGVDIDHQAVEVTKLSLLLKVLEGETTESLSGLWTLFRQRALPDLGHNILCGNSLIGTEIMESAAWEAMSEGERRKINPFDFERAFPRVFKQKGFDAVIGNPPYVRMEEFKDLKSYLRETYQCHDERSDLYAYFMERGHRLVRPGGRFGMIVSNKFLRANYGKPLRSLLPELAKIESVADFAGLPVFQGATVRTLVYLASRDDTDSTPIHYCPPPSLERFKLIQTGNLKVDQNVTESGYPIETASLQSSGWSFARSDLSNLMRRLGDEHPPLSQYTAGQICRGVVSGLTRAFVIDQETRDRLVRQNPEADEILKPLLNGRDIDRYRIDFAHHYLIYTFHGINIRRYPAIEAHLRPFKKELEGRATDQEWYELQQPQLRYAPLMDGHKIIFPDIATEPRFAFDNRGYYGTNTTYFIPRTDPYLLGLLNSRLAYFYFVQKCAGLEGKNETYLRFFGQYLENFPVAQPQKKEDHSRLVALVDSMLSLRERERLSKHPQEKEQLGREMEGVDRRIDRLVYGLYGLTEEEIGIVEGR
jgi:hypothetical protein